MTRSSEDAAILRQAKEIKARENKHRRASRPKRERKIQHARVEPVKDGKQRQPRLRDKVYLGWVAQLPCIACFVESGRFRFGVHVAHCRFSDAGAGWRNPGLQSKPGDDRTTPLCPTHHIADQHPGEERAFWQRIGVWPPEFCADLRAAYEAGRDGTQVIMNHGLAARRRTA